MAPKNRVILDTDPGVDDVLAMMLALSASPEDLELAMISVTYGNVPLQSSISNKSNNWRGSLSDTQDRPDSCLRNVVSLFHVLGEEMEWRKKVGKPTYGALQAFKPIVALGAEHPLEDEILMADHFHGADGLHGVHEKLPHLSPGDTWRELFENDTTAEVKAEPAAAPEAAYTTPFFIASKEPAHKEMLRLLKESPPDTITICAVGPLTNVALAAAEDTETFLRCKELVVMGGAVDVEGNITPQAEFNCYADAVAAARVYALTSPNPASTMPPTIHGKSTLGAYPKNLSRRLKLTLFPLDITTPHELRQEFFNAKVQPLLEAKSPLAEWSETFLKGTFNKILSILGDNPHGIEPGLSLHDPMTIWYMLTRDNPAWKNAGKLEDIRVETCGQWTRGMHVVDRRPWAKPADTDSTVATHSSDPLNDELQFDEIPGDALGWLQSHMGNRINRIVSSPGVDLFPKLLIKQVFAAE
ncbi:Inosine/uridine-preferring nucleoside hydrolase domain-containing protein [Apodospora peruviana]|uniref:Inosine/uridine-preferring nucleoside hydrolase domain-containing protein n=1 Tax=Apodospora peruviana TaxID=516989 RepID=A0AAE0IRU6_9PEZI|nr:Inosine/uridine-preferring nucleoside hydrolase domain-containing protein [Apodospora peruviana]